MEGSVNKRIEYLKISLKIEMFIGLLASLVMAIFLGTMATDSPSSTMVHFTMGALFGFLIVSVPVILVPYLSIRELNKFHAKRRMIISLINASIVLLCVFFPLALWQFYQLYYLNKEVSCA